MILESTNMGDPDEIYCSECGAIFTIFYQRSLMVEYVRFCPFCGDENEEVL